MNILRKLFVLIVALGSVSVSQANLIDIRPDPIDDGRVGSWYEGAYRTLSFDSTTRLMQYSVNWEAEPWYGWSGVPRSGCEFCGAGSIDWIVELDSSGTEVISGGISMFQDFGEGLELAAIGTATDVGAVESQYSDFSNSWELVIPQVAFDLTYTDYRGESVFGNYWIFEVYSYVDDQPTNGFTRSFDLGSDRFSGDAILAYYKVPEPGTLALFVIGLAGMGLARRRKKA